MSVSPSPGDRRVLLSITVEIEDGRVEHLELRDGDVAEEVSAAFCREHNLPLQFVAPLTEHINCNLRSIRGFSPDPSPRSRKSPSPSPRMHGDSRQNTSPRQRRYPGRKYQSIRKSIRGQKFSPRLLQHTYTFSNKTCAAKSKPKQRRRGDLSDKLKAICLRLYSDYLKQRQKIEDDARALQEQYREKVEKEKPVVSAKSRQLMQAREKEARQFHNYGELLYQEGMLKEQERKKLIESKQQEAELNELKMLSPKPEISKFAKQLRCTEKVWERLIHDKQNQGHMQELRTELWESRLMECTFKPRINYLQSLHRRDVQTCTRFEQLFYDAEHRRRRQAEYMQWHTEGVTFRPHINNKTPVGQVLDGKTVFDRLLQYAERVTEKREKLYANNAKPIDPVTGKALFRPSTGRQPLSERNVASLPIGEFLYQMKFALESKKQLLMEKDEQERLELSRPHYVGPRSVKLLDHLKERRLRQIFDYLDKDKDGYVDLETADANGFTDEVIQQLQVVKTMDGSKGSLSGDSFVHLMRAAQTKLGSNGLHAVFKYKHLNEGFPFRFKMSRLSKSLSTRRRKFGSRSQWYKMVLMDRDKSMAKLEALRKEKDKKEMAECTFAPCLQGGKGKKHFPHLRSSQYAPNSAIVEKEKNDMHGFVFDASVGTSHGR